MRTVMVNVQIQVDINNEGDEVEQVINILDQANELIRSLDQQPQIFTTSINSSDISDIDY